MLSSSDLRVAIGCGGRDGQAPGVVSYAMGLLSRYSGSIPGFNFLVVGSDRGTDAEIWKYWIQKERPAAVWPAKWETGSTRGPAAGPYRNAEMHHVWNPVVILAFPGGRGTRGMMGIGIRAGTPVWFYSPQDKMWFQATRE